MSRYRCIVAEKAAYPVRLLCRALGVSASGFYAWWRRGPSDREREDRMLLGWIRAIHGRSLGTYGAPRIHAELEYGHDVHVGRKRVERLMRADGLSGRHLRRRRGLTKQDRMAVPAPDLIGRDFSPTSAAMPGARMVGDITYLATGEGWLYLADALDLATRSVLGYAMTDHMRASLVVDALDMAAGRVHLPVGAIFHSDPGSQYTSLAFARACDRLRVNSVNEPLSAKSKKVASTPSPVGSGDPFIVERGQCHAASSTTASAGRDCRPVELQERQYSVRFEAGFN